MNNLKTSLNGVVTVVFFGGLLLYFTNNPNVFDELLKVPLYVIVALATLKVLRIFINGFVTKFTLEAFDTNISVRETNYLSLITMLGNFFGPILGGASIRAVYLKNRHQFQYSKFISTLYGYYVITFLSNSLIGLVMILILARQDSSIQYQSVLILLATVFILTSLLILIPTSLLRNITERLIIFPKKITDNLVMAIGGWELLKNSKSLIFKLVLINLGVVLFASIESIILYGLFIESFSIMNVILYTILGTLSVLISFTPGAIGIKEGIYVFAAGILLLDTGSILQMATLDRSVTFTLLLVIYSAVKIFKLDKSMQLKESKT